LIFILKKVGGKNIQINSKTSDLLESEDSLTKLKKQIKQAELEKFPPPFYNSVEKEVMIDGNKFTVLCVTYNSSQKSLPKSTLLSMRESAIKIRKLNLVASVLNAMESSSEYLPLEKKNEIENKLLALIDSQEKIPPNISPISYMDKFIEKMIRAIQSETQMENEEIIRKIRNAERYFVAQNNLDRIIVFQTQINQDTIYQIDVPFNYSYPLTTEQKMSFMDIRHGNEYEPKWFKVLPAWEKESLLKLLPDTINGNWNQFTQSSAMQHIP